MTKISLNFDIKDMPRAMDRDQSFSWVTVSYRSVLQFCVAGICLLGATIWLVFPATANAALHSTQSAISRMLVAAGNRTRSAGGPAHAVNNAAAANESKRLQAHFASLDGTVKVLRKDGSAWITASSDTPLEKGDAVQTGSEGMARVVFTDGTSYTLKPDSLIVVAENSTNENFQTQVAVEVSTGTVDLTTSLFSQGSRSQVTIDGAVADLKPESVATVRNDAQHNRRDILMAQGSAKVTRNGQTIDLARNEKASFQTGSTVMAKVTELAPPAALLAPANELPLLLGAKVTPFTWAPVEEASGYRLVVSRDPSFNHLVLSRFVTAANAKVTRLETGAYYWSVRSIDVKGNESMEGERHRFIIVPELQQSNLPLALEDLIGHGHIVEVRGKADAGTRVVVNGEEVPVMDSDGGFHYFTPPLPDGANEITVIALNSHGMNRQVRTIVIQ